MSNQVVTSSVNDTPAAPDLRMLAVADLVPDAMQPRMDLESESTASEFRTLKGLAESIAESGVIQPLVVCALPTGGYQIQSGHRRHAAARLAGQEFVPCIVVSDDGNLASKRISQISENAQRKAMTSKELAAAIQELLRLGLSKGDVARRLGIQESRVTLLTRLFELPERIQDAFSKGNILSPRAAYELERLPKDLQDQLLKGASEIPLTQASVQEARKKWESSGGVRPPLSQMPAMHPTLLAAVTKYLQKDWAKDTYSQAAIHRDRVLMFGQDLISAGSPEASVQNPADTHAEPYSEQGHVRLPNITVEQAQVLMTVIEGLNLVIAPKELYSKNASVRAITDWLAPQLLAIRPHDF